LFISEKNDEDFDDKINYELKSKYQDYVTTIELLSKMKTQLKNLKNSKNNLFNEELEKELEDVENKLNDIKDKIQKKAIEELKKDIPQFNEIKKEIKGIGDYTLLVILPLIATSKNKTAKEIQAYIGLNPVRYESGSSVMKKPKISKRGNSIARKVLYMSAMVAIRTNEIIRQKYERLLKNGKKKRVALTACMAHLLRAVYYQYHNKLVLN
jgi:transposase